MKNYLIILMLLIIGCGPVFASDCMVSDQRPDPKCTPGDVLPVTEHDVCVPLYTAKVRNVPDSEKKQIYAEYGFIPNKSPCPCEVDHFISLELGGSNDIKNLWPESYTNPEGARIKDKVEDYLHRQVCSGNMSLIDAQKAISTNWKTVYEGMHKK